MLISEILEAKFTDFFFTHKTMNKFALNFDQMWALSPVNNSDLP